MNKKVTIKDVAQAAGVSISSVHFALNGKSGVSDPTRDRVRRVAKELGYQPNKAASILRRGVRRIAVLLPTEEGDNSYFYPPVWQGVRDFLLTVDNMNIEAVELPYPYEPSQQDKVLERLYELVDSHMLNGILTVGNLDRIPDSRWQQFYENEIAVVLISSGNPVSRSICCVQPNYDVIGQTMAEIILRSIPSCGSIVLCAGNPRWLEHSLIVRGFESYMHENNALNLVYRVNSWSMGPEDYQSIKKQILRPDVAACGSVLSQSSVLMGRALEETGRADRVFAVGSDLSDENIDRLRRGVLNNIIQKNPYAQGYAGTRALADYLISDKQPAGNTIYVGSEVVFRSNLPMYEPSQYRMQLM